MDWDGVEAEDRNWEADCEEGWWVSLKVEEFDCVELGWTGPS
jgi:hypothetical protein